MNKTFKWCVDFLEALAVKVYAGCEFMPNEKFGYFIEEDEKGITKDIYICKLFR